MSERKIRAQRGARKVYDARNAHRARRDAGAMRRRSAAIGVTSGAARRVPRRGRGVSRLVYGVSAPSARAGVASCARRCGVAMRGWRCARCCMATRRASTRGGATCRGERAARRGIATGSPCAATRESARRHATASASARRRPHRSSCRTLQRVRHFATGARAARQVTNRRACGDRRARPLPDVRRRPTPDARAVTLTARGWCRGGAI